MEPHGVHRFCNGSGSHQGPVVLNDTHVGSLDAMAQSVPQRVAIAMSLVQFDNLDILPEWAGRVRVIGQVTQVGLELLVIQCLICCYDTIALFKWCTK